MDLIILTDDPHNEISRSVTLTNDQWLILSQCVEAFADTYRKQHSQTVATYVTRGQLDVAVLEAQKMNTLLMQLDKLQASIV
jgi:inhibitor of KinA sporulation pathway (predicted exonuclease)